LLVGLSYAVIWPDCMLGYPDSVAHLLALLLVITRRHWKIAAIVLAGLFTDERFILELPLVALWRFSLSPLDRRLLSWAVIPTAAAFCSWLLLRHALTVGWIGAGIPKIATYSDIAGITRSFRPSIGSWSRWSLNVLESFRWGWGVIVSAAIVRWRRGLPLEVGFLIAVLGVSVLSTIVVFDVARSVGFSFLALPLAFLWLNEIGAGIRVGRIAAWLCMLTPAFWFVPTGIIWWRPLALRIVAYVTSNDPMAWQHAVW